MPGKEYQYIRKTFSYNGRRYEVYGTTEEDAIAKKLEKLRELESGAVTSRTTVRQWSKIWLDTYIKPRGLTPKSYRMYPDTLDREILPVIGSQQLRSVTPTQLRQILNRREGMSYSHANHLKIVLQSMFRQAYHDRHIPYDPSAGLVLPKTTKGHHRSLTEPERAALLQVASMPTFTGAKNTTGPWLLCMLYCGLRPGEIAALRWSDVDMEHAILHVKEAKESGSARMKAPKTEAGIRDVPIPQIYLPVLSALPRKSQYVFTQGDGKTPLTESSIRRRWQTVKKHMDIAMGADVEKIKPTGSRKHTLIITQHAIADDLDLYDLRHTYCTDLEKKGVPINIAKDFMGHADVSTTGNIYTHADSTTLEIGRSLIDGKK